MMRRTLSLAVLLTTACDDGAEHMTDANHGGHGSLDAGPDADQRADAAGSPDIGLSPDADLPEGELPREVIFVANGGSANVSVIDPSTLEVVATLSTAAGLFPHHFARSPDGMRLLLSAVSTDLSGGHAGHGAAGTTAIFALDIQRGEVTRLVDVDATAHNAAFIEDGATLVVAMSEHGMIQAYDAASGAETWALPVGEAPLEVTPSADGRLLYVANSGDDTVVVVDLMAREIAATLPVDALPVAAWLASNGNLYTSCEAGGTVVVITRDEPTEVATTLEVGGMPGQAYVTPDGAELWVAIEDRGVVAVFDADDLSLIEEIPAGTKPHGLTFEPSGERAFVTDEGADVVRVFDVASHTALGEIAVGTAPNGILWVTRPPE